MQVPVMTMPANTERATSVITKGVKIFSTTTGKSIYRSLMQQDTHR